MATLIKEQAIGTYSDYYLRLYYEETNVSITNNTSDVTISLYGYTARAESLCSFNNYGTNSISITIDGATDTLGSQNIDTRQWRATGGKLLHSVKKTIAHGSDGAKTIAVSGSIAYQGGGSSLVAGTYSTGSVNQALSTIARASTIGTTTGTTITSTSGNLRVNISKKNTAYYDRVTVSGAISGTYNAGTGTYVDIPWSTLLGGISTDSGTINVTISTYSNSGYTTLIGSNGPTPISVSVDKNSVKPSISWTAQISVNASGLSGKLIAGYSTAKATWSVTNATGASVKSVTVTASRGSVASGASSTSTSGTPVTAQLPSSTSDYTFTLTATVTDSRGATASATTNAATVYGYSTPNLTLTAYRTASNSSTAANPTGAYVYVSWSASVGSSVGGSNAIASTTTSPSGMTSGSWRSLATTATQAFTVTVKDTVGNQASQTVNVGTALIPFDLYSNAAGTSVGVGVGTQATADRFTSNLPAYFNEYIYDSATAQISQNVGSGGNGWFEVTSGTLTGYADANYIILFTKGFSVRGAGIYYLSIRCDNGSTLTVHFNGWLTRVGIPANYVKVGTSGNNWYLYYYDDNTYGATIAKILVASGTGQLLPAKLSNHLTPLSSEPAGTYATDIGIVGTANSASDSNAVKLTGDQTIYGNKWFTAPIWVGGGSETGELQMGIRTAGGDIYMFANSTTRGVCLPASGTAAAQTLIGYNKSTGAVTVGGKTWGSTLLSSSVGTTAVTLTNAYSNYNAIIVRGMPGSTAYSTCIIPKVALTTSDTIYQLTDEASYITFNVRYSGNNIIMNVRSVTSGTKTLQVYGIN